MENKRLKFSKFKNYKWHANIFPGHIIAANRDTMWYALSTTKQRHGYAGSLAGVFGAALTSTVVTRSPIKFTNLLSIYFYSKRK